MVNDHEKDNLIKSSYEENETRVLFGDNEVATISKCNSININLEFINSLRSVNQRKEILKHISSEIVYFHSDEESYEMVSLNNFLEIMKISKQQVIQIPVPKQNDYIKALNTLIYSYNNIWYSCRQSKNAWLYECFENPSDEELDLIVSLSIFEDLSFTLSFVNEIPNLKFTDEEKFIDRAKSLKLEFFQNYEDEDEVNIVLEESKSLKNWNEFINIK